MSSLQDQLLKAGLTDAKKAKQLNKEKRKQARQVPKGEQQADEVALAAKQAQAEKAERDRQLNQQKNAEAERRAIQAQIKQLIAVNRIARGGKDEVAYQFTHGKKIKKIYVSPLQQEQLVKGILAVTEFGGSYELVPAKVAEKISERDAARVLVHNQGSDTIDEDDPYADYQIPDDLMW